MADRHPVDPLAEIDSLLRTELAVEPSHEFLPRVRERIRTEPSPSRWPALWIFAPLAAATAVIVVAIGVFVLTREDGSSPAPLPIASASSPTQAPGAAAPPRHEPLAPELAPPSAGPRPRSARETRRATSDQRTVNDPEVIVDARQRAALLSFIEMARRGEVSAETFAKTIPPPATIADQVKTIAVEELAVSPLVAGGVLLFEVERK